MNDRSSNPVIEAVVHTPGRETAGCGERILLLAATDDDGSVGEALVHLLAPDFQVDGLGLERPGIVAEESLGLAMLAFALLDPERLGRRGSRRVAGDPCRFGLAGLEILLLVLDATPGATVLTPDARAALDAFLRREPRGD